ncbi:MAG: DeoR/GlpR family DNA-binding transcription regulator [Opitutaceae bacterium]|nr:DeoR/GlpR family DNA-binding transcription regulator [Opitutaceae bacterium]
MSLSPQKTTRETAGGPGDRLQFILDRLDKQNACTYEELAELLQVSTMTIRRDLEKLVRQGAVIKTVGGAQRAHAPSYLYETAVYSRLAVHRAEKRAIARQALDLIAAQSTIFIDGSTTCLELARCMAKEKKGLTIVTNSALACLELGKSGDNTIIGIGGQYDANSLCYVGPQAEDLAKELFLDIAFVGTKAFLPTEGTFESSLPTFRIKQIVAGRCARLVLLADHSKMGQRALSKVLDIAQIHTVVTDDQVRPEDLAALTKAGPKVCIAARLTARLERTADVA